MNSLQVHARTSLDFASASLSDLLALPDPEAAHALNMRMAGLARVDEIHSMAPADRIIIWRTFDDRQLWRHLVDPDTDRPFPNLTAWLSSGFLGCRRVAFEAKRLGEKLSDVSSMNLLGVTKDNLHTLAGLSTAVRNDPDVLQAAKTLDNDAFEKKIEKEHPLQHIESRKPLRFNPGRSGAKVVEEMVAYALEHDIAGTRDEALIRAAETALDSWKLDEELRSAPAEETTESAVQ